MLEIPKNVKNCSCNGSTKYGTISFNKLDHEKWLIKDGRTGTQALRKAQKFLSFYYQFSAQWAENGKIVVMLDAKK